MAKAAKKTAKRKSPKASARKRSAASLGKSYSKARTELMKQLKDVDANILISVVTQGKGRVLGQADFFSDWPDTYNRDHWYKTWAKAEFDDLRTIPVRGVRGVRSAKT